MLAAPFMTSGLRIHVDAKFGTLLRAGNRYNIDQREEKLSEYRELLDNLEEEIDDLPTLEEQDAREVLQDAYNDLCTATLQTEEIMGWWLVSPWLAEQLTRANEPVLNDGINHYWGRKGLRPIH